MIVYVGQLFSNGSFAKPTNDIGFGIFPDRSSPHSLGLVSIEPVSCPNFTKLIALSTDYWNNIDLLDHTVSVPDVGKDELKRTHIYIYRKMQKTTTYKEKIICNDLNPKG